MLNGTGFKVSIPPSEEQTEQPAYAALRATRWVPTFAASLFLPLRGPQRQVFVAGVIEGGIPRTPIAASRRFQRRIFLRKALVRCMIRLLSHCT